MPIEEIQIKDLVFEPFITSVEIKTIVERLAEEINRDFHGQELLIVGVLDGSFMFLADLVRHLKVKTSLDFIRIKSYQGISSTGSVKNVLGLRQSLEGKNVLLVEDIIDSGNTMKFLLEQWKNENPASLRLATLLLKPEVFGGQFPVDYSGKEISNRFVVGYGMDYDDLGRELPDIYAVKS